MLNSNAHPAQMTAPISNGAVKFRVLSTRLTVEISIVFETIDCVYITIL